MATNGLGIILRAGLCALSLAAPVASAQAETLRVGGTGVALGGMRMLGDAFAADRPGTTVDVLPSLGSTGGIDALLAGVVDVAVSSRALKDEERAAGAEGQTYARTPLAIVAAPGTPVDAITTAELEAIYDGSMTQWPDGATIRVVLRPETETDTLLLRSLSPEMDRAMDAAYARQGLVVASNDQENADTLEDLPGSIGVVALGQLTTEGRGLRVLALDGVRPSAALAADGGYGFAKELLMVLRPDSSPLARDFAAFVRSPEGRAILSQTDHVPVE